MFNWTLFAILVLISIPGIVVSLPRLVAQIESLADETMLPAQKRPSRRLLLAAGIGQYGSLAALAAAIGTMMAPRVGLSAPFFEALAAGFWSWPAVLAQVWPALLLGTAGALIFVEAYYGFFRTRFDAETRRHSEKLRNEMGMASRLLYGGIFEEVLTRWGLMTLIIWFFGRFTGASSTAVVWAAIVISGVVFGLLHLPSYVMAGSKATPLFVGYSIVMNLWASLIFGWLFWQFGLLAAILAHMVFHLVWWPFDRAYYPEVDLMYQPRWE